MMCLDAPRPTIRAWAYDVQLRGLYQLVNTIAPAMSDSTAGSQPTLNPLNITDFTSVPQIPFVTSN
jgi:hypothetical protein